MRIFWNSVMALVCAMFVLLVVGAYMSFAEADTPTHLVQCSSSVRYEEGSCPEYSIPNSTHIHPE